MQSYPTTSSNPETPTALTVQDVEHLKLLSITGYIWGGVTIFFSCFGLIYFFMGLALAYNKIPNNPQTPPPPEFMGWMFAFMGAAMVLVGWIIGGFTLYAAYCLGTRKNKTLIQVIAAINCLSMPFGTLWGVFVFVVLSRPAVMAVFRNPSDKIRS